MGWRFWARRFLAALVCSFVIIAAAQRLKGHTLDYAVREGVLWSVITATVFVAALRYRSWRGQACAICEVPAAPATPERNNRT